MDSGDSNVKIVREHRTCTTSTKNSFVQKLERADYTSFLTRLTKEYFEELLQLKDLDSGFLDFEALAASAIPSFASQMRNNILHWGSLFQSYADWNSLAMWVYDGEDTDLSDDLMYYLSRRLLYENYPSFKHFAKRIVQDGTKEPCFPNGDAYSGSPLYDLHRKYNWKILEFTYHLTKQ